MRSTAGTGARDTTGATVDLVALVAVLAAEGLKFGTDLAAKLAQGQRLTHGQRQALQRIAAERAAAEAHPSSSTGPPWSRGTSSLQQPAPEGSRPIREEV